jgi:hypothetical protein
MIQVKDEVYPTLPLEILRSLVDDRSYQVKVDYAGVEAIRLRNVGTFKTDENARIWINFDTEFNKISLTDSCPTEPCLSIKELGILSVDNWSRSTLMIYSPFHK